jgi:hypothetical protein
MKIAYPFIDDAKEMKIEQSHQRQIEEIMSGMKYSRLSGIFLIFLHEEIPERFWTSQNDNMSISMLSY